MGLTASAVWVDVLPSMKNFGVNLAREASGAGTRTGDAMGAELEKAAGNAGKRAGIAMATGVEAATARIEQAARSISTARDKEADAAGRVRIAEQKLEEVRAAGKSGSAIATAEERLATARRGLTTASNGTIKAAHDLELAEHKAAQATDEVSTSSEKSGGKLAGFANGMLDVGKKAAGFAVAMVAVGGGMDLVGQALGKADLTANLQAKLGATPALAAHYGQLAGELYAGNYGDSLGAVDDALAQVMRSGAVMEDATSEEIKAVTGHALDLSKVFGVDVAGSMRTVGIMMRTGMAPDAETALDIVTRGFQQGVDVAGDFLETLDEYSTQFRKLGLDGTTATGLLSQGLHAGARDADKVADALKEFSIRAVDGTVLTGQGFTALGLDASAMGAQIGRGGQDASAGLQTVLDKLRGISDPVKQSQAAVALFGAQAEDLGAALLALDPSSAVDALGTVGGAADAMGETLASTPSAALATFGREVQTWLVDLLGGKVVPVIATVGTFLRDNFGPAVKAGGEALATFGKWVQDNSAWLIPLVIGLGTFAAVYESIVLVTALWAARTAVLTLAQWALNVALNANPIGLIIAAVVALIAVFVWLWNNNEGFRNFWISLWETIKSAAVAVWTGFLKPVFEAIVAAVHWVADAAVAVGHAFATAWTAVGDAASWLWSTILEPLFSGISFALRLLGAIIFTVLVTPFVIAFNILSAIVSWAYTNSIKPIFDALGVVFRWLYQVVVKPNIDAVVLIFHFLADSAMWLYDNGIKPALAAIGVVFDALGVVVGWVIDAVVAYIRAWAAVVSWIYTDVILVVLGAIGAVFTWLWDTVISPVIQYVMAGLAALGAAFGWVYDNVIKPVWDALGAAVRWVFDNVISPAFHAITDGVSGVGQAFSDAVDFIGKVWDKIKGIVAAPINFVINTVYNDGIRAVWNKVAGFAGLDELPKMDPITFAGGGVLGGYAPGRDVIPALLSPGESVLTPEATRLLGARNILALNASVSGRRGTVADGSGRVHRFGGGGVVGDLLGWIPGIGDEIVALWTDPAKYIAGKIGGGSQWLRAIAAMPGEMISSAAEWLWGKLKGVFSFGSSSGGAPSGDLAGWIMAAIGITGVGADWVSPLNTLIMRESGGNPSAINLTDSNAQAGYPSEGLMQTIPQTFAAYRDQRLPNVITDPVANIVAGINYILARYGSIFNVQQAVGATPLGYDSGGYLAPGWSSVYNGTGKPEPVLSGTQWESLQSNGTGSGGEPVRIVGTLAVADDGLNVLVSGHIEAAGHATGTAILNRRR